MKCDICSEPADTHVTEVTDGVLHNLHLCTEHAQGIAAELDYPLTTWPGGSTCVTVRVTQAQIANRETIDVALPDGRSTTLRLSRRMADGMLFIQKDAAGQCHGGRFLIKVVADAWTQACVVADPDPNAPTKLRAADRRTTRPRTPGNGQNNGRTTGEQRENNGRTTGEQRENNALLLSTAATAAEAGRGRAAARRRRPRSSGGPSGGDALEHGSRRERSCLHYIAHATTCQVLVRYFLKEISIR